MLLYELFKADVVSAQFTYAIENTAFTGVKEGKVLGHLQQRPSNDGRQNNFVCKLTVSKDIMTEYNNGEESRKKNTGT